MANEMDKFFGLDNPSGQAALVKEREKLDAEIKAAFGVQCRLLGKDVTLKGGINNESEDNVAGSKLPDGGSPGAGVVCSSSGTYTYSYSHSHSHTYSDANSSPGAD